MTSVASSVTAEQVAPSSTVQRVSAGGLTRALWTLYTLTLRQHLHGRRWMIMAVLFLLPAVLAVFLRTTAPDVPAVGLEFLLVFMFIPQALLPLVALLYASGIIQDEQEEQTITYLLVRPIPKWAMYVVRLVATLTTTVFLVVTFTVVIYVAIYAGAGVTAENPAMRCLKAASIHALAVVAYCSLFGLMGLVTKRVLVVGIVYTAVVEGLLANLPFGIRLVTVIYYTRLMAYRTLEFVVATPRDQSVNMAAEAWQFDLRRDPELLEHPQFSTCLTVLLVGSLVCTLLAALLCAGREFHVKTPEKD